ncbi:MAG: GntR family transcriptional regulator [Peptostreptococcaceae bacterium]
MKFIPNDNEAVYLQIVRYIKQLIVKGILNPGDPIPSRREMAVNLKVNPNTVQKAYKEMEDMEIINTVRTHQSTITSDENVIKNIRTELIQESLKAFISNMKAIDVEKDEIIKIIKDEY